MMWTFQTYFIALFALTNSNILGLDPISIVKLFTDLKFFELENIVYRYRNEGEKHLYNKYECFNQLFLMKSGLESGEMWALKGEIKKKTCFVVFK